MFELRRGGEKAVDDEHINGNGYVEMDPSGRYGRFDDALGKGAMKTVYKAFDEVNGIEVAWNQAKICDVMRSPEALQRMYSEVHLLSSLKHESIIRFHTSWINVEQRTFNFITELFTSGTLREYRQRYRRVDIRAIKSWARQILNGLVYLHSHDPPVIHRDLKCDNIFVNGNQGEVKIGDLGLAAILRKSHAVHCVGTPEFMAPEVYQEEYNELVDIYSFGMCVLEMVTFEYPYSECTHPAEIYKKVISGTKPEAFYRVKDREVKQFVEKCLATASRRQSARELLNDPFLQIDDFGSNAVEDTCSMGLIFRQPTLHHYQSNGSLLSNGFSSNFDHESGMVNCWEYDNSYLEEAHGMDLFNGHDDDYPANIGITIKGRRREDGSIFLRLRIADKDGRIRNIHFPFDIEDDTALSVATEMVAELDITDYEVTRIADMIDGEVIMLEPDWKPGPGIEDMEGVLKDICHVCASNVSSCDSVLDYISKMNPSNGLQSVHCRCAEVHGRFEEVTFRVEEPEHCVTDGAPLLLTSQLDGLDLNSQSIDHLSDGHIQLESLYKDEIITPINGGSRSESRKSLDDLCSPNSHRHQYLKMPQGYHYSQPIVSDDHVKRLQEEQRPLEVDNQMDAEDSSQQLTGSWRVYHPSLDISNKGFIFEKEVSGSTVFKPLKTRHRRLESFHLGTHNSFRIPDSDVNLLSPNIRVPAGEDFGHCWISCPDFQSQMCQEYEIDTTSDSRIMLTAENFYAGNLLPETLHRAKSLPVDVIDV